MEREVGELLASVLEVPLADVVVDGFGPQSCANWDSLRHLRIVLALEDRFACVFEAREIHRLVSVPAIARVLREKLG